MRYLKALLLLVLLPSLASAQTAVLGPSANPPDAVLYDYRNSVQLQDEFASGSTGSAGVGTLGWFLANGTTTQQASIINRPGILRRDTSSSSGTIAYMLLGGNQGTLDVSYAYTMIWIARANEFDANTKIRLGATSDCTLTTFTRGVHFEKLDADTNWFAVTRLDAGNVTRTDTGVAVSAVFRTFQIDYTPASVRFLIDGAIVATHTTNLPATSGTTACAQIVNSAAASKTIDYDYFQLKVTGITR